MSNIKQLPHFEEVANLFASVMLDVHPSFVHGCWIGLIAGGRHHSPKAWVEFITQKTDGWSSQGLPVQHMFLSIAEASVEQLGDMHYVLQLLLPDDEDPLEDRVHAVSEWCNGFIRAIKDSKIDVTTYLGNDAKEAFADMEDITQVSIDVEHDPQAEENYAEVVEYLRVAVSLIHQDILSGRTQAGQHSPYLH
jgi:uncharacterized protein YgfB (UPF0149 family)